MYPPFGRNIKLPQSHGALIRYQLTCEKMANLGSKRDEREREKEEREVRERVLFLF